MLEQKFLEEWISLLTSKLGDEGKIIVRDARYEIESPYFYAILEINHITIDITDHCLRRDVESFSSSADLRKQQEDILGDVCYSMRFQPDPYSLMFHGDIVESKSSTFKLIHIRHGAYINFEKLWCETWRNLANKYQLNAKTNQFLPNDLLHIINSYVFWTRPLQSLQEINEHFYLLDEQFRRKAEI